MFNMTAIKSLLAVGVIGLLAGCGGGGAGGPSGGTTAANITLSLIDPGTGNASTALASGSPLTVTALVKDSKGAVVPNTVVTFTTDANYGSFSPASGTALTNTNGIATITLNAGATTGAGTVTASANANGAATTTNSGFSVNVAALTLDGMTFGVANDTLSAYGTTSVSVTVKSGNAVYTTPIDVSFASTCSATDDKATLPATVRTVNGIATASYRDNGCGSVDQVTATLASGATLSKSLTVTAPGVSSIQFVSATPTNINIKGMGGTEVSTITFKVLDAGNNAINGQTVNFTLNTTVGGLTLSANSAVSNPDGEVTTQVIAGTVLTPVRVTATIDQTAVSSQSSQLYVSTMVPDQAHFSLSAEKFALEALTTDGVTTQLIARLADRFGNPVPDNTTVTFTAEGGAISPGCTTTNGACTVTWTSQDPRPANGRATILAYALGEESFTDDNGDMRFDDSETFTSLAEAFMDVNENGVRDTGEFFVDLDASGTHTAADALYNGVLCTGPTLCAAAKNIHVRGSLVLTFSGSAPRTGTTAADSLFYSDAARTTPMTALNLGGTASAAVIYPIYLKIRDVNGNSLATGTTIEATLEDNGNLIGSKAFTVPAGGATDFTVRVQNDATGTPVTDSTTTGSLTIKVKTPAGIETSDAIPVTN